MARGSAWSSSHSAGQILKSLRPEVRQGESVFVSVAPTQVHELPYEAVIREKEGTTVVFRRQAAEGAGLSYDYVAGWIALTVHSAWIQLD